MYKYKRKRVTETRDVPVKHLCDKCGKEFRTRYVGLDGKQYKNECGSVHATLHMESDYLITKDIWQTYRDMELCFDCYNKFMEWLEGK